MKLESGHLPGSIPFPRRKLAKYELCQNSKTIQCSIEKPEEKGNRCPRYD